MEYLSIVITGRRVVNGQVTEELPGRSYMIPLKSRAELLKEEIAALQAELESELQGGSFGLPAGCELKHKKE